jgi:NADPH-dependent glutamate synthase beta subunit-like oxidoreductase
VGLIAQGKPEEAYKLILERVPLPGILGRVCTHPCEESCKRGDVNQPVSICVLKRFAADHAGDAFEQSIHVREDNGHKVAVIGAGPAGLTVAFLLRRKGYQVRIIEAQSRPGGMMRYGIPNFRLPESILDQEINQILNLGIELITDTQLGTDTSLDQLREEGFEAFFIASGLWESRKIDLEGTDSKDVLWGLDFLIDVAQGEDVEVGSKVVVIGGGNVAVDVALSVLRLGAGEVSMVCLECREEMPANPWDIELAQEEEIQILPSWGPARILREGNQLTGIELIECTSVFDESGIFNPTFSEKRKALEADQVILAIGQTADLSFLDAGLRKDQSDLIAVELETQKTDLKGVFAGGDVASGPSSIIEAIASGRRAASAIDKYLGGDGVVDERLSDAEALQGQPSSRDTGFAELIRVETPLIDLSERRSGFIEIEDCLSGDQAIFEAGRCFHCDLEAQLARDGKVRWQEAE